MAEQVQKEQTMEDILSSIREMITEDSGPKHAAGQNDPAPEEQHDDPLAQHTMPGQDTPPVQADMVPEDTGMPPEAVALSPPVTEREVAPDPAPVDYDAIANDTGNTDGPDAFVAGETPGVESPPSPVPQAVQPMIDTRTDSVIANSLGALMSHVGSQAPATPAASGTTLESLAADLLRPMLKEWLDVNLPGIVEHQVQAEINRISRKAG